MSFLCPLDHCPQTIVTHFQRFYPAGGNGRLSVLPGVFGLVFVVAGQISPGKVRTGGGKYGNGVAGIGAAPVTPAKGANGQYLHPCGYGYSPGNIRAGSCAKGKAYGVGGKLLVHGATIGPVEQGVSGVPVHPLGYRGSIPLLHTRGGIGKSMCKAKNAGRGKGRGQRETQDRV